MGGVIIWDEKGMAGTWMGYTGCIYDRYLRQDDIFLYLLDANGITISKYHFLPKY